MSNNSCVTKKSLSNKKEVVYICIYNHFWKKNNKGVGSTLSKNHDHLVLTNNISYKVEDLGIKIMVDFCCFVCFTVYEIIFTSLEHFEYYFSFSTSVFFCFTSVHYCY